MAKVQISDRKSTYKRLIGLVEEIDVARADSIQAIFEAELQRALRDEDISGPEADQLRIASAMILSWTTNSNAGAEAVLQWSAFVDSAASVVLPAMLDVLARKLPRQARTEAIEASLAELTLASARILLSQKVIGASGILAAAKKHSADFFASPLLDLLLEDIRKPAPRKVWESSETLRARSDGLLTASEALAASFALEKKPDAIKWLIGFLSSRPDCRRDVLGQLLRDEPTVARLAHGLCTEGVTLSGKRDKKLIGPCSTLVTDLLMVCADAIQNARQTTQVAIATSAILTIGIQTALERYDAAAIEACHAFEEEVTRSRVAGRLWARHSDPASSAKSEVFACSEESLYAGVQEYLARMTGGDSAIYDRMMGRRELVEALLPILERLEGLEREALHVTLYNAGVREIALSEGAVTFDEFAHEGAEPGLLPGDAVKVIEAGWYMGAGTERIILRRARVRGA